VRPIVWQEGTGKGEERVKEEHKASSTAAADDEDGRVCSSCADAPYSLVSTPLQTHMH